MVGRGRARKGTTSETDAHWQAGAMVSDSDPTPDTGPRDEREPDAGEREPRQAPLDRSMIIGIGVRGLSTWLLRFLIIGVGVSAILWLLSRVWVGVLPVVLALIVSSVLWPVVAWLRRHGWRPVLAAAVVVVGALVLVAAVLTFTIRPIAGQWVDLANRAATGLQQLQQWLTGPPLSLSSETLDELVSAVVDRLRGSASQIASGVFSGVSAAASTLINTVLVLVLTFLFLKDGSAFLPWLRRQTGRVIGGHLTEVLARSWRTVSDFIRVQALVSLVDAVFIGLGLVLLGVPLAPALAVLTFIAGFVPIVGAVTAGALAVLVALVSNGWTTALLVLGLILLVQQLESNVLQPLLQGRSLKLHAAIVLLSVTAGGTLFGITGAFLAVPVVAVAATVLRYLSEQIALRAGEVRAADVETKTPQGENAAQQGERAAQRLLRRWRERRDQRA